MDGFLPKGLKKAWHLGRAEDPNNKSHLSEPCHGSPNCFRFAS